MLEEIEKALSAEDPRLAKQAATAGQAPQFQFNIQSIAVMLLGLVILIGGVALSQFSLWFVALSVLGFLVMFGGGLLSFRKSADAAGDGRKLNVKRERFSAAPGRSSSGGFGDKMEDKFRSRFDR